MNKEKLNQLVQILIHFFSSNVFWCFNNDDDDDDDRDEEQDKNMFFKLVLTEFYLGLK